VIRSEAEKLVAAVTRTFEADSQRMSTLLDQAVGEPVTTLADGRTPQFRRSARLDLLAQGARAGSIGYVAISAAGTTAGLVGATASVAILPLAPVGLAMMVFFGRRAFAAARENELRANRAVAQQAVDRLLAYTRRDAHQESADTRDRILHTLQNVFTEEAAELAVSAQRNRKASARAIKLDWDANRARLTAVDTEIARLRTLLAPPATPPGTTAEK
jgi:hypothetical protein